MAERLTSQDMNIISRALDLADLSEDAAEDQGYAYAFGQARELLRELVMIVEGLASDRITGKGPRP